MSPNVLTTNPARTPSALTTASRNDAGRSTGHGRLVALADVHARIPFVIKAWTYGNAAAALAASLVL